MAGTNDWSDLAMYGLYALEAGVLAAAGHLGRPVKKTHWDKVSLAAWLRDNHGFPDVESLMTELNTARKAAAYGEDDVPEVLDAQEVASRIEQFVDAVAKLLAEATSP